MPDQADGIIIVVATLAGILFLIIGDIYFVDRKPRQLPARNIGFLWTSIVVVIITIITFNAIQYVKNKMRLWMKPKGFIIGILQRIHFNRHIH